MPNLYGMLNIAEAAAEKTYISQVGQTIVYSAVAQLLTQHNADLQAAMRIFVNKTTTDYKRRYKTAGGGYLQPRGIAARPGNQKTKGEWDVAFPILDFGDELSENEIVTAYMTAAELKRQVDTVMQRNINTVRREILKSIFDNGVWNFVDQIRGVLAVQPLANGDATVYPAVIGAEAGAVENHYLATGYLASAISNANDPTQAVRDELEEHYGAPTGGSNIAMFVPVAIGKKIEGLTTFDEVPNRHLRVGANQNVPVDLPENTPGRVLGIQNGVWVIEWRSLPDDYSVSIYTEAEPPLEMREDPEETGLSSGLQLVTKDEEAPFESAFYRNRFGFGAANRLNGVVQHFTTGSYAVPAGFSH